MRYVPDAAAFRAIARPGAPAPAPQLVPVYRQLLGDRLTPVTAFEVLGRDDHAFLLESVVGGERVGRYSFIATGPSVVYVVFDGKAAVLRQHQRPAEFPTTDPLADLQKLLPARRYHRDPSLPAFTGGLVGYAGYDVARYYEPEKLAAAPADDRRLPDLLFGLYNELVIFDHVDKTIKVVSNADLTKFKSDEQDAAPDDAAVDAAYRDACRRVDELVMRLQQPPLSKLGEIDARGPL
jgi:anthranilate synthase component 1